MMRVSMGVDLCTVDFPVSLIQLSTSEDKIGVAHSDALLAECFNERFL